MNADVYDMAHAQGALVGAVHPFDAEPNPFANPPESIMDELPVDVALGKLDYMEIVGFSDHRSTAAVWYRAVESWVPYSCGSWDRCDDRLCGTDSRSSGNGSRVRARSERAGEFGCLDGFLEKWANVCDERTAA